MRHVSTSIALALSTLLLVSISSAQRTAATSQQTATSDGNPAKTTKSDVGIDTVVNCTIAKNGAIPVFTAAAPPNITICNSVIFQANGNIGIGTTTPAAVLDVTGATNTSLYYEIGGSSVLNIGSAADSNLFVGVGAGSSNVTGQGTTDTFVGFQAGYKNTDGYFNTFSGYQAGYGNIGGYGNTFSGWRAGVGNTNGYNNVFSGAGAGLDNTTGGENTFVGVYAGGQNNGTLNTFVGSQAGTQNTTGNNNIYIGNLGPISGTESNTIRIGGDIGIGYGPQTSAYILGIYGSTSSSGIPVYVNSNGQVGTLTSSVRFKEQVRGMGDSSDALMKLRPVTFLYKPEYDKGERTLQYGLIAEEVAEVYPELVAYDDDGQPYSVRYQYITTMLLNEVQKQYHRAEAEAKVITAQEQKIDELEQRLSRLEGLVRAQVQTLAQELE
jgi:trimeric autotransporter adhesin